MTYISMLHRRWRPIAGTPFVLRSSCKSRILVVEVSLRITVEEITITITLSCFLKWFFYGSNRDRATRRLASFRGFNSNLFFEKHLWRFHIAVLSCEELMDIRRIEQWWATCEDTGIFDDSWTKTYSDFDLSFQSSSSRSGCRAVKS